MAAPVKGRGWQRCRRLFRAFRICVLLLVLVVVAAGTYLNEVGLPDFVKRPLLEKLKARGVELQFSRLRLRWHRGVVAEDVSFCPTGQAAGGPRLSLKEVELKINHAALMKRQLNVDSIILHDGKFIWALVASNRPAQRLSATNIQAQLRFLTNDQWRLDDFTATFAGAKLKLSGSVTNATSLSDWKLFQPRPSAGPELTQTRLRDLVETIEKLKFSTPPELIVRFNGDARRLESFSALLTLKAPGADTPWGSLTNGGMIVRLIAPEAATNAPEVDLQLHADEAFVQPGRAKNLVLHLHATAHEDMTNLVQARLEASADSFSTEWVQAGGAQLKAEWTHSLTNSIPLSGTAELHLTDARTRWGTAGMLDLNTRLNPPATNALPQADASWAWWASLEPYSLDWNCRLREVHTEDAQAGVFEFKELACGGLWRAPELTVTNAHAELYRGRFDARATVDVATRAVNFSATSDFDGQKMSPLLTEGGRHWLGQYTWEDPPLAHVTGSVILPAWTNRQPDWRGEVLPTLELRGDVKAGAAAFREVPVSSAAFHFTYSNMIWNLPDLVAVRPEGRIELATEANDRSQRYHFLIHSAVDPKALRKLLPSAGQAGLDAFIFTQPPVVDAEIWGHWHDPDQIGVKAHVTLTNFALRGESATHFHGDVQYTNGFIILTDARLENGEQFITASALGVDPAARKAYVTNGFSIMDGTPFFRVIGPKVTEVMEPYHFLQPAAVHADGTIPLAEDVAPDLHFKVDGGPFNWLHFNLDHVTGNLDWVGKHLTITNAQGEFYGGTMSAGAAFDFTPKLGGYFSFDLLVTDASLQALMGDISPRTNRMEGRLSGELKINHAYTEDFGSWAGGGSVDLRDGLIWNIPVFGIFSQVLDSLADGLGESRADRGAGDFTITNSVIHSDNLEIRAPALRMSYRGTVDFNGNVDAVVEARFFRGMPLVGWVVSTVLYPATKLFAYKVTGTLDEPKKEPQFLLTKPLMLLLNPVQTLKGMAPPDNSADTNAPPPAPVP